MASFVGTISEFIHFFGNNLLSNAASKYAEEYKKIIVKKCEWKRVPELKNLRGNDCQCDTKHPREAAHKHEYNKLLITIQILKKGKYQHPEKKGFVKVDLDEFLKDFYLEHKPISESFYTLCKKHHEKYDHLDEEFFPNFAGQKKEIADYKKGPYTTYGFPEITQGVYTINNIESTGSKFLFTHALIKKLVECHPEWDYDKLFEVVRIIHDGTKNKIIEKLEKAKSTPKGTYNIDDNYIIKLGQEEIVVYYSINSEMYKKVLWLCNDRPEFVDSKKI